MSHALSATALAPARAAGRLQRREDDSLPVRFARSAATTDGLLGMDDVLAWLAARRAADTARISRVALTGLDGWSFQEGTGDLTHHSGRFFAVGGVHVTAEDGPVREWRQPIIRQPEVGILGLLAKEFDGVPHVLLQAKMEPGNPGGVVQLSPTVQATRSNFTKVHGGSSVRYIEYFTDPDRARIVSDSLQSEHGSWFLHKSNRNMTVVTRDDDVPVHEAFCWLTLGQIGALLREDDTVNMDTRTVLSCLPVAVPDGGLPPADDGGFAAAVQRSAAPHGPSLHRDIDVLSWMTAERARRSLTVHSVPLGDLPDWGLEDGTLCHREGRYFDVVGVGVEADNREVARWSQPLLRPRGKGVCAFLTRRVDGVLHLLAHARAEAGLPDTVQIAPTVQYTPGNYDWLPADRRPRFLQEVVDGTAGAVRYEATHAEEGGRFLDAESSYRLIEVSEDFPAQEPPGHRWLTLAQLLMLCDHDNRVNVQARTLLACLKLCFPPAH